MDGGLSIWLWAFRLWRFFSTSCAQVSSKAPRRSCTVCLQTRRSLAVSSRRYISPRSRYFTDDYLVGGTISAPHHTTVCTILRLCGPISLLVYKVLITARFSNMRNLKFNSSPTVAYCAAVNNNRNIVKDRENRNLQNGSKSTNHSEERDLLTPLNSIYSFSEKVLITARNYFF